MKFKLHFLKKFLHNIYVKSLIDYIFLQSISCAKLNNFCNQKKSHPCLYHRLSSESSVYVRFMPKFLML